MFSDFTSDVVGFQSINDDNKTYEDGSCQTCGDELSDSHVQTKVFSHQGLQTEVSMQNIPTQRYDESKLAEFLNRIYPDLSNELTNFASISYQDPNEGFEELGVSAMKVGTIDSKPEMIGKKVSSMSWNSTGMTLAVSYSECEHRDRWCTHDGSVYLYNTSNLTDISIVRKLETTACVTTLLFHPWTPSILAAGLHNGEVCVWDFRIDDDPVLTKKNTSDQDCHMSAVTQVCWTPNLAGPVLVSAGRDGLILFWKMSYAYHTIEVETRYFLSTEHIQNTRLEERLGLEVMSLSFWSEGDEFVCATQGGGILHCAPKGARPLLSDSQLHDPVVFNYDVEVGVVSCVCCLVGSDLFAATTMNGNIFVYKSRQVEPIHTIYIGGEIYGAIWTHMVHLLLCWGDSGTVCCYRATTQKNIPSLNLVNDGAQIISTVCANKERKGVTAVGSSDGSVYLWKLPERR